MVRKLDVISVNDAAQIINVSAVRVRQFIADGRLAAQRVGKSYIIRRADAEELAKIERKNGRPRQD